MLKPKKSRLFGAIFRVYCRNLIRRNFDSVRIHQDSIPLFDSENQPLLICANHSSWWDGLIAYYISSHFSHDAFFMMEEKHLRRYYPFQYLGAFSVDRDNPFKAARSILFTSKLLSNEMRSVWMFPQGEIKPNRVRPIETYRGAELISRKTKGLNVVAVSMRYEFLQEAKPEIFIRARKVSEFDLLGETLADMLDEIGMDIVESRLEDYVGT